MVDCNDIAILIILRVFVTIKKYFMQLITLFELHGFLSQFTPCISGSWRESKLCIVCGSYSPAPASTAALGIKQTFTPVLKADDD